MKKVMKYTRILDNIIPKKNNKICFLVAYNHTNACLAYYNYLIKNHKNDYDYTIIINTPEAPHENNLKIQNLYPYTSFIGIFRAITSKYVVCTHCNFLLDIFNSDKHIYLHFNHGMPIKKVGLTRNVYDQDLKRQCKLLGEKANLFVTSDIFKLITIACYKANYNNVHITGTPRNDLIASTVNDDKLKKYFEFDKYAKTILYMPTWKNNSEGTDAQVNMSYNNIFYLNDFDEKDFIKTIEENNILFIMKPHPISENFYKQNCNVLPKSQNFKIVYNDYFYSNQIEHYELFKFIDLMISDYSSAPLDYLILNRPVAYLNNLADDYNKTRGIILEDNYEILMPGIKILTYNNLKSQLIDILNGDSYKEEREKLLPIIHKYRDFNTCERIYQIMKTLK